MKTIAIAIDEATLERLDRATRTSARARSRSALVRQAVREHLDRRDRACREESEAAILAKHRDRLARQSRALVEDQAEP